MNSPLAQMWRIDRIRYYHKKLEKMIGDDRYISTESEFKRCINEDVPDPRGETYKVLMVKGHEEPYQGYDLPDINDFSLDTNDSNNEDIFDSYLGAEILFPDQDGNKKTVNIIKQVKGVHLY